MGKKQIVELVGGFIAALIFFFVAGLYLTATAPYGSYPSDFSSASVSPNTTK